MHICIAGAPGSVFTRARPSRNCSFVSQARRSCTSAWISPQIAGAPKPRMPTFRKAAATSRYLRIVSFMALLLLMGEREPLAFALRERPAIDGDRRGDVLQAGAGRIEDNDFIGTRASALAAGDDLAQLGVHVLARHRSGGDRMVQVADLARLLGEVGHHRGGRQQRRVDLLLVLAVGADRRDE